jgi:hypothetical protein
MVGSAAVITTVVDPTSHDRITPTLVDVTALSHVAPRDHSPVENAR